MNKNQFLQPNISRSFYDEIIDAAAVIAKIKGDANYVIISGKCACCGATMEDENSPHDIECIWHKE